MDNEIKAKLLDIFELDDIEDSQVLRDLDTWDSLAGLSLIALADSDFGFTLSAQELKSIQTVGELVEYLKVHAKR